ncbi:MAG: SCO family protein [Acidobacteriota bacterium]
MRYALVAAAGLAVLAGCSRPPQLPVYGEIPRFTLTSQSGGTFDSKSLAGKIWVADFMFTRCMGPCPRMTSQMHSIQKKTADVAGVRFVSFTIDPEYDTPPVLAAYAKRFRADPERWFFLTGAVPTLQNLNRNAFKLGDIDGSMMHSTRFVLVDRVGRVRGYYRTEEGESLDPLIAGIRSLAKEPS